MGFGALGAGGGGASWKRITDIAHGADVNVQDPRYGYVSGASDHLAALDAAEAACPVNGVIFVPKATYVLSATWLVPGSKTLVFAPGVVLQTDGFSDDALFHYQDTELQTDRRQGGIFGFPTFDGVTNGGSGTNAAWIGCIIESSSQMIYELGAIVGFSIGLQLLSQQINSPNAISYNQITTGRIRDYSVAGIELKVNAAAQASFISSNHIMTRQLKGVSGGTTIGVRVTRQGSPTDDNLADNRIYIASMEAPATGTHTGVQFKAGKNNVISMQHVEAIQTIMDIDATEGDVENNKVIIDDTANPAVTANILLPTSNPGNAFWGNEVISTTELNHNNSYTSPDFFSSAYQSDGSTNIGVPGLMIKPNDNSGPLESDTLGTESLRVNFDGESGSVTAVTQANPGVVTITAHPFIDGDLVVFENIGGMTELNENGYIVANSTANTFELNTVAGANVNTSAFTAYTTGGTATAVPNSWDGIFQNGYVTFSSTSKMIGRYLDTRHHKTFTVAFAAGRPDTVTGRIAITAYNKSGTQFTPSTNTEQSWHVQATGLTTTSNYGEGWVTTNNVTTGGRTFTVSDSVAYVFAGIGNAPEIRNLTISVNPLSIVRHSFKSWTIFGSPSVTAAPTTFGYYPLGWQANDSAVPGNRIATTKGFAVTSAHASSTAYTAGQSWVVNGGRVYLAATTGTSSTTAPTHTDGGVTTDGGVGWLDLGPVAVFSTH